MKKRIGLLIAVVCLTIFCLVGSLGAVVYRYQDLSLQGLPISGTGLNPASIKAVNDSAWIVGNYYDSTSLTDYRPFVWRPGLGQTTLQGSLASAFCINNQGQIAGQADTFPGPLKACYWSGPSAAPVGLYTSSESIVGGNAYGINEAGQVAGEGNFTQFGPTHATLWPANHSTATDLNTLGGDTSTGRAINNAGWVVGTAATAAGATPSQNHACLWVPGQPPQELVTLPPNGWFSSGIAINTSGNVVGQADLTPGLGVGHAFFWNQVTKVAQDMCPADYASDPTGISDANQVVGFVMSMENPSQSPVFYWTPTGGKKDLNKLVVNLPAGVTLKTAVAISRNGKYITGFDSQGHPYLLTATAYVPISLLLSD